MILCCYAKLWPSTEASLRGLDLRYIDVSGSPAAYWETLARFWTTPEPLINIEHDVVIGPETVPSLLECGQPWCAFAYAGTSWESNTGLGCGKFSAEAREMITPEVVERAPYFCYLHPQQTERCMCWVHVDASIFNAFRGNRCKVSHARHRAAPDAGVSPQLTC